MVEYLGIDQILRAAKSFQPSRSAQRVEVALTLEECQSLAALLAFRDAMTPEKWARLLGALKEVIGSDALIYEGNSRKREVLAEIAASVEGLRHE